MFLGKLVAVRPPYYITRRGSKEAEIAELIWHTFIPFRCTITFLVN